MVTGVYCLYSVNGRVEHAPIYKRGHYYGSLDVEKYASVERCVAILVGTGFTLDNGRTLVTLTNRLFPEQ